MRTVFHVTTGDPDEQARALSSARSLLADDTVDVEAVAFVANSHAVRMLMRGATNADRIRSLLRDGVAFKACSNSMRGANLTPDLLIEDVEPVASGVGELTRLQSDGYAYVRL